jgi:hypothetical protein
MSEPGTLLAPVLERLQKDGWRLVAQPDPLRDQLAAVSMTPLEYVQRVCEAKGEAGVVAFADEHPGICCEAFDALRQQENRK